MTIKTFDEFIGESTMHKPSGIRTYDAGETPHVYALTNQDAFNAFVKGIGMKLEPDGTLKLNSAKKRKQFFRDYEATSSEFTDFELGGNFDVMDWF